VKNALKMFVLTLTVLAFARVGIGAAKPPEMKTDQATTENTAEKPKAEKEVKGKSARSAMKSEKSAKNEEGKPAGTK
jgi:hypothetical protein